MNRKKLTPNQDNDRVENGMTLKGKVALVISPDNEDGRFLIRSLARKGSDIVFVCLQGVTQTALRLKGEVEDLGRRCLLVIGADLTSWQFSQQLMKQIVEVFGRLDVFIDVSAQVEETEHEQEKLLPHVPVITAVLKQIVA